MENDLVKFFVLLTLGFLLMTVVNQAGVSRGIRNNNPGNIRGSSSFKWDGEIGRDDLDFAVFDEPENGIRAMSKLLINYQRLHGIDTVRGLINRWAPDTENNTVSYVDHVASALGVDADQSISVAAYLRDLVDVITLHENGKNPYSDEVISEGIRRAVA